MFDIRKGLVVSAALLSLGTTVALPKLDTEAGLSFGIPSAEAAAAQLRYRFAEVKHYHGTVSMPATAKFSNINGKLVYRADLTDESYAYSFLTGRSSMPAETQGRQLIASLYKGDRIDRIQVVNSEPGYAKLVVEGYLKNRGRLFKSAIIIFDGSEQYVVAYLVKPNKLKAFARERELYLNSFKLYMD